MMDSNLRNLFIVPYCNYKKLLENTELRLPEGRIIGGFEIIAEKYCPDDRGFLFDDNGVMYTIIFEKEEE